MKQQMVGVFVAAALVVGCSSEPRRAPGSKPILTPVHDATLRAHMARLEQLVVERLPAAMDSEKAREEIAREATELVSAAKSLPEIADDLDLSHDEKALFYTLADSLDVSAQQLASEAATGDAESVMARYEAIVPSCVGCHNLFRELPE